ncbi:hypothetical protein BDZ91DRAFT_846311 [Kalaharituber pfeilii]|nr:hypothetical protein BDZ91DRAFT_846311 [Kalaharituber pfeilii]
MDLLLLTRPDAENQVKACLSSLKPVERAEALIAMGNMLSELNQKNIQECGQAATVLLAAIESYKPWSAMGIEKESFSSMACIDKLKAMAEYHYDTTRHRKSAEMKISKRQHYNISSSDDRKRILEALAR